MFVPLHDDNPLENIPRQYVTWGLIAANVAVFLFFQGAMMGEAGYAAVFAYGLIPSTIFDVDFRPDDLAVVPDAATFVTYSFLHADILHLGGNMLFLWVFGDNIEDAMGHVRFLIFYLLCAVAGGALYTLIMAGSSVPLIGASGAVAGIVSAYLVLHPKVRVWALALGRFPVRLTALWVLGLWIAFQVVNVLIAQESEVAWWAHIGGIIAGALLIVIFRRPGVPLFDRGVAT